MSLHSAISDWRATRFGFAAAALFLLIPATARADAGVPAAASRAPERAGELPAGLTSDDWGQIQRALADSDYGARRESKGDPASLLATNREQGYRTTFRREGIEIVPQPAGGSAWRLGVFVDSYGYAGDLRRLAPAEPRGERERVEYRRGPVTEWYVNRPGGLEQGFELQEPAPRRDAPLVIGMSVRGDLIPDVDEKGASVAFRAGSGKSIVRYADLKVWDADGRPLRSRIEAEDQSVRLVVEAQQARFPVTVDPGFVNEAKVLGSTDNTVVQANIEFGNAVSLSGDTAVVGAALDNNVIGNAGAVYVFLRTGSTWSLQQKITAPDAALNDQFGFSVAIAGDTLVVGANLDDTTTGADTGSVYVFVRSGTTWSLQQQLTASDAQPSDEFGYSVSISGETAVVGARLDDNGAGTDAGSAYVFLRSGTTWSEQAILNATGGAAGDEFGYSVSVSGDRAAVGARFNDTLASNAGAAYVFLRTGTAWAQEQQLTASDGAVDDEFGHSVAINGDSVVAGANLHDILVPGPFTDAGAAYVFVRDTMLSTWSEQQKLVASDRNNTDQFGIAVAISGNTAVVGAKEEDRGGGLANAGAGYAFLRSGTTWTEQAKLTAGDAANGDRFGASVAVDGSTALFGAPEDNDSAGVGGNQGSAYVFVRPASTWSQQAKLTPSDGAANDQFGSTVAVSGDTVIVGAPFDDGAGGGNAGSASVFVRSGGSWVLQQKLLSPDGAEFDQFGISVSISGDTAAVGARLADIVAGLNTGAVYVFLRSGSVWSFQQKLTASDAATDDELGHSVAISGDTVVAGARLDDLTGIDTGSAYVFVRSGVSWTEQAKLTASDGLTNDTFGHSVAISGDSVIVGARLDDTTANNTGSAYVFLRSGTSWSQQQKLVAGDAGSEDRFGVSVSISGDTAVVGARADDVPGTLVGATYVFVRSGSTWMQQGPRLTASDAAAGDEFGFSVSVSGNTVVAGAYADDHALGTNAGSAYVFERSGTTWTQTQKLTASDGAANDQFGRSVAVDAQTIVAGANLDDTTTTNDAGSAYIHRAQANLGITKTDGQTSVQAGASVTYTIAVTNAGPATATGATVTDVFPVELTGVSWTCVASAGSSCGAPSGTGNLGQTINLAVLGTATYTATGTLSTSAAGTLTNTATVAPPASLTDPLPGNNSANDVDTVIALADLSITKDDGLTLATTGTIVTYTIVVSNAGPTAAVGANVSDPVPASLTSVSWTCAAAGGSSCGAASGNGNINQTVTAAVGGTVTYTLTGTVIANPTSLINTATVAAPAGMVDLNLTNNSATDEDQLVCAGEIVIIPDGRLTRHTLGASATQLFQFAIKLGNSYSLELKNTTGTSTLPGTLTVFAGDDGCSGTSTLTTRDTSGIDPSSGAGVVRVSFTASGADATFRARLVNGVASSIPYSFSLSDTTLYSASWSTNGSFNSFYSFQNTTNATVSGTLTFLSTSGTPVGSPATVTVPAGQTTSTNSVLLTLPRGQTGTVRFTHDGPPGSIVAEAAIANFTLNPAYIQPVRFQPVREAR